MAAKPKTPTLQVRDFPLSLLNLIGGIAQIAGADRDAMVTEWLQIRAKEDDGLPQSELQRKYVHLPRAKRTR